MYVYMWRPMHVIQPTGCVGGNSTIREVDVVGFTFVKFQKISTVFHYSTHVEETCIRQGGLKCHRFSFISVTEYTSSDSFYNFGCRTFAQYFDTGMTSGIRPPNGGYD